MSHGARRLALLGLALLLLAPLDASAIDAEVVTLRDTGPSSNRVDLVVVGEGYTADQQTKLEDDAQRLIAGLFTYEPWTSFSGLVNAKLLKVVSNEQGADYGSHGEERDTAFDAHYLCGGIDRLLCVDGFLVLQTVAEYVPEFDWAVVLVNDEKYGGSGGAVAVASLHPLALPILVHEIAHQIGGLADEYETPNPAYPDCSRVEDCPEPNATIRTSLEELKWSAWVEPDAPIPSPESYDGVGLFEGARYQPIGVYRPTRDCMMRSYDSHAFCPICSEALILAFLRDARPIDEAIPAQPPPFTTCDDDVVLQITTPLDPKNLRITWTLGGVPIAQDVLELHLPRAALQPGENEVAVQVEDLTQSVRVDPDGLLVDRRVFTVEGGSCAVPCRDGVVCRGSVCSLTPAPDGTACGGSTCTEGTQLVNVCAEGECVQKAQACAPYRCDASGAACAVACTADTDCVTGQCVAGSCTGVAGAEGDQGCGGCSGSGSATAIGGLVALAALKRRRGVRRCNRGSGRSRSFRSKR